ncbi:VOC family protein [Actinomycetota bacterium Odt1-20B]
MLNPTYLTGAPVWVDLGTPDLQAAAVFYGGLLGWEFEQGAPEFGGYSLFKLEGQSVAGAMTVPPEEGAPAWSTYFKTPDADATAKAVEQAGGGGTFGIMDVADLGRMAGFTDATGVPFSVWQPGTNHGLGVIKQTGALTWSELYTPDVPAALAFYRSVFGWNAYEVRMSEEYTYTTVNPGEGTQDDMFGGVADVADDPIEQQAGAYWLPYFAVDDCAAAVARARELGATVRAEPMSVPGAGDIAKLADPQGARFALIKPDPSGAPAG